MNVPSAATSSSTELRDLLDSLAPAQILDVRTPTEFETAHIPGSHNVPLDVLRARRSDVIGRLDDDVVLV